MSAGMYGRFVKMPCLFCCVSRLLLINESPLGNSFTNKALHTFVNNCFLLHSQSDYYVDSLCNVLDQKCATCNIMLFYRDATFMLLVMILMHICIL